MERSSLKMFQLEYSLHNFCWKHWIKSEDHFNDSNSKCFFYWERLLCISSWKGTKKNIPLLGDKWLKTGLNLLCAKAVEWSKKSRVWSSRNKSTEIGSSQLLVRVPLIFFYAIQIYSKPLLAVDIVRFKSLFPLSTPFRSYKHTTAPRNWKSFTVFSVKGRLNGYKWGEVMFGAL